MISDSESWLPAHKTRKSFASIPTCCLEWRSFGCDSACKALASSTRPTKGMNLDDFIVISFLLAVTFIMIVWYAQRGDIDGTAIGHAH